MMKPVRCALVFVLVSVMCIDALPSCHRFHSEAREFLDPALDRLGLWQGPWNLFAPEVDKLNSCIVVEFRSDSGRVYRWQSPDPAKMGVVAKFRNFRWFEYYDSIRLDANAAAWPSLVAWLEARPDVVPAGERVERTRVWRAWGDVSPESLSQPDSYPFSNRYLIYDGGAVDAR